MLTKHCLICGKAITKPFSCSLREWNEVRKFCSRKCFHLSLVGKPPWNKGLTKEISGIVKKSSDRMINNNPMKRREVRDKSSKSHTGYRMPETQRRSISKTHKKRVKVGLNNLHPNWKPKEIIENKRIWDVDYKIWRTKVFTRDNWTCQKCGRKRKKGDRVILEAHHKKSWAKYPKLRFKVENGKTLCKECHKLITNCTTNL